MFTCYCVIDKYKQCKTLPIKINEYFWIVLFVVAVSGVSLLSKAVFVAGKQLNDTKYFNIVVSIVILKR